MLPGRSINGRPVALPKFNRYLFALIYIFGVIFIGTMGYRYLEDWGWIDSLYMTISIVTTVGIGEIYTLDSSGRLFSIFLICFGVGAVAYGFTLFFELIFARSVNLLMGGRTMQKEIDKMQNHTILCGYGRMGSLVADELREDCRTCIVVIETDIERIAEIERRGLAHVQGDATDEEVLAKAGIDNASTLISVLSTDADNIFLTLTARGMNATLNIIARASEERSFRKFKQAGATHVVSPIVTGANRIARLLTAPSWVQLIEVVSGSSCESRLEVLETLIEEESPYIGKTLVETKMRQQLGQMVFAVRDKSGKLTFNPPPDRPLHQGETLLSIREQPR